MLSQNTDVARLMLWQKLEPEATSLIVQKKSSSLNWAKIIKKFQDQGQIRKDIEPNHLVSHMINSFMGLMLDSTYAPNHSDREQITRIIIQSVISYVTLHQRTTKADLS